MEDPEKKSQNNERVEQLEGALKKILDLAAAPDTTTVAELEKALLEVKTLRGILPICSFCKKIRDDHGDWSQVEEYVKERSEADFSHGICPDCMKEQYPREYDAIQSKNK